MADSKSTSEYWANIVVTLEEPLQSDELADGQQIVGYGRLFGLRAERERVRELLDAEIEDGVIDWSSADWYEIDPSTLDPEVRERVIPIQGEGIWYRSGRMYFPNEVPRS